MFSYLGSFIDLTDVNNVHQYTIHIILLQVFPLLDATTGDYKSYT